MGSSSRGGRAAGIAAGLIFIILVSLLVWIGAVSRRPEVVLPPALTSADTATAVHIVPPSVKAKKTKVKKAVKESRRTRPRSRDFLNEPVLSISSDSVADTRGR